MDINVYNISSGLSDKQFDQIINHFSHIKQSLKAMATKLEELQQLATDLQASVNAMEAQNAQAIQELKDIIAAGGTVTDADLQGVIDTLSATRADVESTDDDI